MLYLPTKAYDANGNIKGMWQKGLMVSSSAYIDKLVYDYKPSSNKLASVTDGITADNKLGDFSDGNNTGTDDYDYDANGNLSHDQNKAISDITYNHLNQPSVIRVFGKGVITYTYDAADTKLQKQTVDSTGSEVKTTTTQYIGGIVYVNNTLQYIPHEEGRIRRKAILTSGDNSHVDNGEGFEGEFIYDYFIKDHLGNVRTMLTDEVKTDVYHASLEDASLEMETLLFSNLAGIVDKPSCFDGDSGNGKVQKVEAKGMMIQW